MEMKWNPIVNGDLSEVPLFEDILFTIIDEDTGTSYVIYDEINLGFARKNIAVFNRNGSLKREEKVIAWSELPEPFKPKDCNICAYRKEWTDEFGDNWFECELLQCDVPPNGKLNDCPLKR